MSTTPLVNSSYGSLKVSKSNLLYNYRAKEKENDNNPQIEVVQKKIKINNPIQDIRKLKFSNLKNNNDILKKIW